MIDVHIHVVPPNLPGVGSLSQGLRASAENVARVVRDQMMAAGVQAALAMGSMEGGIEDPLGLKRTLEICDKVLGLYAIGAIDPRRTEREYLLAAERAMADNRVMALKAYLGYLHVFPNDPGYRPYYELAARYKKPVFFHTGDTYSPYAKLKFAHPLLIDEVAVDFPTTKFVMAHAGNPWMLDAAEVIYKNMNVWADLSGWLVGDEDSFGSPANEAERVDIRERFVKAFRHAGRPNRFLYGSDWPLAPMPAYSDFIRTIVPVEFQSMVFHDNAELLFGMSFPG
jgi:uncharacterized protein